MRTVLWTLTVLAVLGLAAGAAIVFGGLYNVSARLGHLPITSWALHTTFRNSVELWSPPPSAVPPLTEEMARLGARHFDGACRICHGGPGEQRFWTIRSMVPVPPPIQEAVAEWEPNHLHWIVHQGVKMSGMPQWPSIREDEVWAIVAFLTRVEEMDAATYAAWTASPPASPEGPPGLAYCAGCHGLDGRSGNPHIPRLDLQDEAYLAQALGSFLDRSRESGVMSHAASVVPPEALPELAAYFAGQGPTPEAHPVDATLAVRGEALAHAETHDPEVPACVACHGPRGRGGVTPDLVGPALAGQYEAYLLAQLRLWREGIRGGGPRADLMEKAAQHLTDADIAALASYFAGLLPMPDEVR
jgi:cytochrome c553